MCCSDRALRINLSVCGAETGPGTVSHTDIDMREFGGIGPSQKVNRMLAPNNLFCWLRWHVWAKHAYRNAIKLAERDVRAGEDMGWHLERINELEEYRPRPFRIYAGTSLRLPTALFKFRKYVWGR